MIDPAITGGILFPSWLGSSWVLHQEELERIAGNSEACASLIPLLLQWNPEMDKAI